MASTGFIVRPGIIKQDILRAQSLSQQLPHGAIKLKDFRPITFYGSGIKFWPKCSLKAKA
ncbi:hypothetical protein H5410_024707 [Solanum commersonii]|uniref:Uncharacterized protein n=1 Tax=Solanum commersonii TaxID=4109 RepID=A0A9J5ZMU0_SOLCO|nr:hypothetical protein H5410_024707 [Solanum commersonii]